MTPKLTLLFFVITISTTAFSMIIRHDADPNLYLADESKYPAVFPVQINGKRKECVATLIDPKWAITAAHCTALIDLSNKKPYHVLINKKYYDVKSVQIHPDFGEVKGVRDENGKLIDIIMNPKNMSYDVALIELNQSIKDVKPIDLYTSKDEVNQEVLLLGWGDYANGKAGTTRDEPVNDGQFRKAYNRIDGIEDNYLTFSFDAPQSSSVHELEGVNGPGDSGGPALIVKDKKKYVAGVSSRGYYLNEDENYQAEGKYGWIENYVRVSTTINWLKKVMDQNTVSLLKQYEGDYMFEPVGVIINIYTKAKENNSKLYFKSLGEAESELIATGKSTFVFKADEAMKIEFLGENNGVFKELNLIQPDEIVNAVRMEVEDLITIDKKLTQRGFSGVILVAENDKILFNKAYGRKNNQSNGLIDINTVFDICSITKQFTAAGILKLSMQNKLSVDDKLSKYFNTIPNDKKNITIHQLLTHSSGLTAEVGGDYDTITEDEFLRKVFNSKIISPAGKEFHYSNMGYSLLALIIEKSSGMNYEAFLNAVLFNPAKMNHTGYIIPDWKTNEVANGFLDGVAAKKPNKENWSEQGPYLNLKGNGGILTKASDLLLWSQAITNNTVLDKESTSKYLYPHFEFNNGNAHYGYGWAIKNNNSENKLIHHSGGSELFSSDLWIYPEKGITVIVLSNTFDLYVLSIAKRISSFLLKNQTY